MRNNNDDGRNVDDDTARNSNSHHGQPFSQNAPAKFPTYQLYQIINDRKSLYGSIVRN